MAKKRLIILGAGISGLALGWYLKKYARNPVDVTILEKDSRAGGWIQTENRGSFLFECGPRSCRPKGIGMDTLGLIEELGLQQEIILPSAQAKKRYIRAGQQLRQLPTDLLSLFRSPFFGTILKGCWKDLRTPPLSPSMDESIESFFSRRMGKDIAAYFADPLTAGIFAGDAKRLSIQSCFSEMQKYEREHGGILRSLFKKGKKSAYEETSEFVRTLQKYSLYTFANGMETLPRALHCQLHSHVHLNSPARRVQKTAAGMEVELESGRKLQADRLFSTLSAPCLSELIDNTPIKSFLKQIPYSSVVVLNLGYSRPVLKQAGYGYLIPGDQQEKVLGVVWNSCVFPQHSPSLQSTSLTVMMGGMRHPEFIHLAKEEIMQTALKALYGHLSIQADPDFMAISRAHAAIPQYLVGHALLIQEIQSLCKHAFPQMDLLGTSFFGVSVNDCVAQAKGTALKTCKELSL